MPDKDSTTKPATPDYPGRLSGFDYFLLSLPFIALLVPKIYARQTPELFGVPFFYCYLFAWVLLSAGLTAIVYWRTRA